jgi:hypothetical protein
MMQSVDGAFAGAGFSTTAFTSVTLPLVLPGSMTP